MLLKLKIADSAISWLNNFLSGSQLSTQGPNEGSSVTNNVKKQQPGKT
jgi:hypothetical protein